jgi:hypothetical protein
VILRPQGIGQFEFVVLASLRASQLKRGCRPRVEGHHTVAVTAQLEIAGGTVVALPPAPPPATPPSADDASESAAGS